MEPLVWDTSIKVTQTFVLEKRSDNLKDPSIKGMGTTRYVTKRIDKIIVF